MAILLWSCAKEQTPTTEPSTKPILFGIGEVESRATHLTTSNLLSFGVSCFYTGTANFDTGSSFTPNMAHNQLIERTSPVATWGTATPLYWPAAATEKVSFFAYAPYASVSSQNGISLSGNSVAGTPVLTYLTPYDALQHPDLLIGVAIKDKTKSETSIQFTMKHALASIGFKIKGQSELIKSVGIKGAYREGSIAMDASEGISWTNPTNIDNSTPVNCGMTYDSGKSYYTATATLKNVTSTNGYLMMIPQSMTDATKIVVTLNDNTTKEISLAGQAAWIAGAKILYDITLAP